MGIGLYEAPAFGAGHDHSRCLKFRVAEQRGGDEGHRFLDAVGLDRQWVAHLAADDRANSFKMGRRLRSEEHTSELPSLMRISSAVFCLKKKNNDNNKLTQ